MTIIPFSIESFSYINVKNSNRPNNIWCISFSRNKFQYYANTTILKIISIMANIVLFYEFFVKLSMTCPFKGRIDVLHSWNTSISASLYWNSIDVLDDVRVCNQRKRGFSKILFKYNVFNQVQRVLFQGCWPRGHIIALLISKAFHSLQ